MRGKQQVCPCPNLRSHPQSPQEPSTSPSSSLEHPRVFLLGCKKMNGNGERSSYLALLGTVLMWTWGSNSSWACEVSSECPGQEGTAILALSTCPGVGEPPGAKRSSGPVCRKAGEMQPANTQPTQSRAGLEPAGTLRGAGHTWAPGQALLGPLGLGRSRWGGGSGTPRAPRLLSTASAPLTVTASP